jgi:acetyl esterase
MPAPNRVTYAWRLIAMLERSGPAATDPTVLRAESNRRRRLSRLPIAQFVTGRFDRRAVAEDSFADLADGTTLSLRIYRPRSQGDRTLPVVVNFHGGGWVSGDPRQSDWWCSSVAAGAGVVVVSVDYRLAPEYPFPTAVEDSYAATCWVVERADALAVDASRVAVMGDSAGGNLAAVVSLLARDRGGPKIGLQVLIYPAVEMIDEFPSKAENAEAPVLRAVDMDRHRDVYLNGADGSDPLASPLRAEHAGLPPALIQTAQYDPLRDQGAAYADALRSAGVDVRLTNYADAVHGYASIPGLVPQARQALADAVEEIGRAFAADPASDAAER